MTRDDYEHQIEFLADAEGVDLGGIGMQSHFSRENRLTPDEILAAFDRYAAAGDGASLRITEFDMGDPNWLEEDKADFFHWFLKTAFSHPDLEDFMMWGFWDGDHWQEDAPLFYDDWEEKPTHEVYTDLVFEEWWTDENGHTEGGEFATTAFLGEYELTITLENGKVETTLSVDDPTGKSIEIQVIDIDVRGSGQGTGRVPVCINWGEEFDPAELEYDTVRLGSPEAINANEGSKVIHRPGTNGQGHGRSNQLVHFDGSDVALDEHVLLFGRTEDDRIVVGLDML